MTTDLFGYELPTSDAAIISAFVKSVKRRGRDSFNSFRAREGIDSVPKSIGGAIRAACLEHGLTPDGTTTARVKTSHYRLCQAWAVAR